MGSKPSRGRVYYRRLNFNICFNLALLLASAMLLIDFVSIGISQRLLIKNKATEGKLLIKAIEQRLHPLGSEVAGNLLDSVESLLNESDYAYAAVFDPNLMERFAVGKADVSYGEVALAMQKAIISRQTDTQLIGATWGVFWRQKAFLMQSAPLYNGGVLTGGISIVFHLQHIYQQLRYAQLFAFIYILINLILLSFLGRYRFSRLTIVPLKKLVETAEANTEGRETLFLGSEKDGNEFNQLSNALNQMLSRISKDQENLKLSVRSLKQANLDLKKAQNDIINAEKLASVGRLSAGIAHEIGNPLTIIIGYLELLKRKDISPSEREDFITRAESEISRIHHIIRQLLDFSRPSSNIIGRISVHEILSDIGTIFQYQPLLRHIEFKLSLSALEDGVRTDASLLRQAFINLAINAADAVNQADRTGSLLVQTQNFPCSDSKDTHQWLEITFMDNGIGIPAGELNFIFEPFYTTKAPGKGTGLGLSVCYMIVEAAGGRIEARSEEGIGTTMIITLPLWGGE